MNDKPADRPLMIAVFSLVVFGLVMIFSAGVVLSFHDFGTPYYYFLHQLFYGIIPGVVVWVIIQQIDYHKWDKWAFPLFLVTIIMLILVFIPPIGQTYKGASRWINLGVHFQPTEIAKLTVILYLSAWLSRRKDKVRDLMEGFMPFVAVLVLLSVLIAMQPDIGTLGVIVITSVIIFFLASGRISHLLMLMVAGIAALFMLVKVAPYRAARLLVFLNPEADPQGIGYQINQALITIGSGGLWGIGLGHGRQKFLYLPEPIGDSIYAIIGEELGFLGAVALLALFLIVSYRGFLIAQKAPDLFGKLVAGGITGWLVFQALINIAAITGLIPLTGIPLPFVSYGSSALIVSLIGTGILLNISKHTT